MLSDLTGKVRALLDACLQLVGAAYSNSDAGLYLPVGIESLQLTKSPGNAVWAYVQVKPDNQIIKADFQLINDAGETIGAIAGLSLQYLSHQSLNKLVSSTPTESSDKCIYEIKWQKQNLDRVTHPNQILPNKWFIFAEKNKFAEKLAAGLRKENCILVFPGEQYQNLGERQYQVNPKQLQDFQQLWKHLDHSATWGVIHLWEIEYDQSVLENTLEKIAARQTRSCASVLHLMQSIDTKQQRFLQLS